MIRPIKTGSSVLVTGGAGFIGSHLVEQLVSSGARVTVLDDLSTGSRKNLAAVSSGVELVITELGEGLRAQAVDPASFDFIFHLAANPYIPTSVEKPDLDYRSNLEATFALLEALRKASRKPTLVIASSAAVYGNPVRLPMREDDPTVPISPYGVSKLAGERYLAVYASIYDVPAVSLRLFSTYGPRQRKQVVYDLMTKIQADPSAIDVIGDGSQERDFGYVGDVAQAFVTAATCAPARGETFNVASGRSVTIGELLTLISNVWNASPRVNFSGQVRPGDAQTWRVDISALTALGFAPKVTLDEGLRAVKDWMLGG